MKLKNKNILDDEFWNFIRDLINDFTPYQQINSEVIKKSGNKALKN